MDAQTLTYVRVSFHHEVRVSFQNDAGLLIQSEPRFVLFALRSDTELDTLAVMFPAYFITFHTYGTWLHGHESGSVDPKHNAPGTPLLPASEPMQLRDARNLRSRPFSLNAAQRTIVHRTIEEVCRHRQWALHAMQVRTTHVHVVVSADVSPERVMNSFKTWCTRRLNEAGHAADRFWSRHGSTRWLNVEASLNAACTYVMNCQGRELPMT